jgi:hypothetical protein
MNPDSQPARDERREELGEYQFSDLVETVIELEATCESHRNFEAHLKAEHEAVLAAARQVDEAAKQRAIDGLLAKSSNVTETMKVVARAMWADAIDEYEQERAALLAALNVEGKR